MDYPDFLVSTSDGGYFALKQDFDFGPLSGAHLGPNINNKSGNSRVPLLTNVKPMEFPIMTICFCTILTTLLTQL